MLAMRDAAIGSGAAFGLMQIIGLLLAGSVMALRVRVVLPCIGVVLTRIRVILRNGARGSGCDQANSEDHGFHGLSLRISAPATAARVLNRYAAFRMNAL